ncbi:Hypothetical protein PHPALM_14368 [Phytophthora palmivora]|uniref:Uncharacterized protein n=1 Tax=Phytophthora palmivora TaxID=4796 RepID=A0A2P4XUV1_9STRA|nr:Hypothetical protein PHPALM_14368 [Phytophthora palmivora]
MLTPTEMKVLAQDAEALKDMRADGWSYDMSMRPVRTEAYSGLFSGESGPTENVLSKSEN